MIDYNKKVIDRLCQEASSLKVSKKVYTAHRVEGKLFKVFTSHYEPCSIKELERVFQRSKFPYNNAIEYNYFIEHRTNKLTINDGYNEYCLEA